MQLANCWIAAATSSKLGRRKTRSLKNERPFSCFTDVSEAREPNLRLTIPD
jgi:hypothetical protein